MQTLCAHCKLVHEYRQFFSPRLCIETLQRVLHETRVRMASIEYDARKQSDLKRVVADQRRHIAMLEEELRPHIRVVQQVVTQEELL